MRSLLRGRGSQSLAASIAYVVLTVVMTWPIARGLTHDVPADLGDSLLNMWIMAWDGEAFLAVLSGAMSFADAWNGNIFHPAPLTLTYSEHLLPQALQGLPAYLATGNIVLAYNLVFLGTYVLSGLGTFLLVRELTGSARAGFVAGLFYAFLPYRLGQFPHIQTISSQWMPFALWGLRRYFDTGRWRALAGAVVAFVVQGLSTGYYLFFFAPVFGAYALWEIAVRRRWLDWRTWAALAVAAAASLALTLPFLLPYARARDTLGFTRPFGEVLSFSADLYAYLNAPPQTYLWGPILNRFPQPEGDLFMGALPMLLALAALAVWVWRALAASRGVAIAATPAARRVVVAMLAVMAIALVAAVGIAVTGGVMWDVGGTIIRATNVKRTLMIAALCCGIGLVLSPRWRAAVSAFPRDLTPVLLAGVVFAVVMSLGPAPHAGGVRLAGLELYSTFFTYVPGYDGLRAPARFGMVAAALLAPLAGYALAAIAGWRRFGTTALCAIGLVFLAEGFAVPQVVSRSWDSGPRYASPWPTLHRLNDGPLAYRHLLAMPDDTVVLELPLGDGAWDLRFVYYAGLHGKRIVNGYSGYFPDGYRARAARLSNLWADPDAAWEAVASSGATHVLLHVNAYHEPEGRAVAAWLDAKGARATVGFDDGDFLYELPRPAVRAESPGP